MTGSISMASRVCSASCPFFIGDLNFFSRGKDLCKGEFQLLLYSTWVALPIVIDGCHKGLILHHPLTPFTLHKTTVLARLVRLLICCLNANRTELCYLNVLGPPTGVCRLIEGVPTISAAVANHSCVHNSIMGSVGLIH